MTDILTFQTHRFETKFLKNGSFANLASLPFDWTEECSTTFQALKTLTFPLIMAFPDFIQPFILSTDALNYDVFSVKGHSLDTSDTTSTDITDHHPFLSLCKLDVTHDPTGQRGCWALELDPYQWTIITKKKRNTQTLWPSGFRRDHLSPAELSVLPPEVA